MANLENQLLKETVDVLESNLDLGLNNSQLVKKESTYGKNIIPEEKNKNIFYFIVESFKDITVIILFFALAFSLYISLSSPKIDLTEPIVIAGIILLNIFLAVREQVKAEKSMEALKQYSVDFCKVLREGKIVKIESENIYPGDIIILEMGNKIPADARIIEQTGFSVDESILTGESEPSIKDETFLPKDESLLIEKKNIVFSGTMVVSGKAKAIVLETSNNTEVGKITKLLSQRKIEQAPLQKRMQKLGKTLSVYAICAAGLAILIGFLRGYELSYVLMVAISVAVAAIPEVMPVVVTISLSYGVTRMAKKNTLVRTPTAVETIGNISVICSDKTGTITQNKMQVKKLWVVNKDEKNDTCELDSSFKELISKAFLASALDFDNINEITNPTEKAIANIFNTKIDNKKELMNYSKIHEIPFDSSRKQMTVLYKKEDGKYLSVTKGAFDRLDFAIDTDMNQAVKENEAFTNQALRVIAVGYKIYDEQPAILNEEFLEKELTLCGILGILDPPREESKVAVAVAKQAGIKTIMITGDHLKTAKAIAEDVGILYENYKIMDGSFLVKLSESELEDIIDNYTVFARTSPLDKIRIVKALQKKGEIVAMTGDGVNDAPALKAADVGIAMGSGTDVAKQASDMVLLDDNFSTIVKAVEEGRKVYSNIRKSIYAMLGCNVSALAIVLLSLILGWGAPVTPILLLIIKVACDGIPGFSLCAEQAEPDIMAQQPIKKGTSIFANGMLKKITIISAVFTITTLVALYLEKNIFNTASVNNDVNTMTFIVLGLTTVVHVYNCRSSKSIFSIGVFSNKVVTITTAFGAFVLVILTTIPPIRSFFGFTPLSVLAWVVVLFLSFMPLLFIEIQKKIGKFGKI